MRHLREDCDPARTEVTRVDHRGGRAEVTRCVDCAAQVVTWLDPPRPELPDGITPIRVPNPTNAGVIT